MKIRPQCWCYRAKKCHLCDLEARGQLLFGKVNIKNNKRHLFCGPHAVVVEVEITKRKGGRRRGV